MVDIQKKPIKLRDPVYKNARSARREAEQRLRARKMDDEARRIDRGLRRPSKQTAYANEMELFDKVKEGYHGEIGYKLLGNKRLAIDKNGKRTRKRGVVRKTTEVLERDPQSGTVYVSQLEREGWRKKARYEFGPKGELRSCSLELKNGRFREEWERDEKGHLIRTSYYTNRLRDGRFFSAISERISAPDENAVDNKKYRILTRTKGSRKEVFERDEDGKLELIGRESRGFSKYSRKSPDRRTEVTETKTLFGVKLYTSLLDPKGNELGRNITSHRRLWNKESATFDESTYQLTDTKHTLGKLFKREARYVGRDAKVVTTKVLGIKLKTRLKGLQEHEQNAQKMRAAEAMQHKAAWENTSHFDAPSNEGNRVEGDHHSNSVSTRNIDKIMLAVHSQATAAREIPSASGSASKSEALQVDFGKAQPPKYQSMLDSGGTLREHDDPSGMPVLAAARHGDEAAKPAGADTVLEALPTFDAANRNDAIKDEFSITQLPKHESTLNSGANDYPWGMPQWKAASHGHETTKPAGADTTPKVLPTSDVASRFEPLKDDFSKAQPPNYRSSSAVSAAPNGRRMAMMEAARRRDEAAERAGLDTRTVASIGRC
ncbi:effector protein (plasmid) [Bradyrhizobium quebecense]|uniref:Effector protein n=1 Tax=Bradyrhizobium quebecense TaxID=2748629 RepID=A0A973WVY5_9BRAD|nr:effector protein [Bradyrhizobium quebecense]UGA48995.1 effector protein [Bradyrhizobium quebecense]